MFCGLRFKFVFYQNVLHFLCHLRAHLAQFLRKNHSENRFKKRDPPTWKLHPIPVSDGSQRRRLACALLNSNNCPSSNCCSNSCPSLRWLHFEIEKLLENGCLSWLLLQKFRKQFEKWKGLISKAHFWWSDTLVGQGPANFRLINITFG